MFECFLTKVCLDSYYCFVMRNESVQAAIRIRILIGVCFLLISLSTIHAQYPDSTKTGFEFYPQLIDFVFEDPDLGESVGSFGLSFAGKFDLVETSFYRLSLGISFSFLNLEQKDYKLHFICDENPDGTINEKDSWVRANTKIYALGLPLENKFFLTQGRSRVYINLGASLLANIVYGQTNKQYRCTEYHDDYDKGALYAPNLGVILVNGGFGIEHELKSRASFYIQPQVTYSLNNIFESTSTINNSKYLNFGVALGYRLR